MSQYGFHPRAEIGAPRFTCKREPFATVDPFAGAVSGSAIKDGRSGFLLAASNVRSIAENDVVGGYFDHLEIVSLKVEKSK